MRSRYFAGEKFFEDFTIHYSQTISKMIKKEWPSTKIIGWFDPFIVRYDGGKKDELHLHNDVSHITMVVKLNNDFKGGVLKLPRQKFDNKKMNGTGNGFFEYEITLPNKLKSKKYKDAYFIVEVSAKELFDKDKKGKEYVDLGIDYMKGSKVSPSKNPNSYPMTDTKKFE